MSHCTTFPIVLQDKRLLFRALRNLGLNPENRVWKGFSSDLRKKMGIGGELLGKLLTGTLEDMHIFFVETDDGLQPFVECSSLFGEDLDRAGGRLILDVQKAYLRCAVDEIVRQYRQSGLPVQVREESIDAGMSFFITMGDSSKEVVVTQLADGTIEERVKGIAGGSCTTATEPIERLLTLPQQLTRTWTSEYNTMIEDREIQVLRLHRDG